MSRGVNANPPDRLNDFSGFSGLAPSTCAATEVTGKTPMSSGVPPMTLVTTLLKWIWPSPGARNPELPAARSVRRCDAW